MNHAHNYRECQVGSITEFTVDEGIQEECADKKILINLGPALLDAVNNCSNWVVVIFRHSVRAGAVSSAQLDVISIQASKD